MIGTPPETDISFFEAIARIVRESGLSHAEIARRANAPIKEAIAKIEDPAERILTEMSIHYLHRATISRVVRGVSSISDDALARIAVGLNLDKETHHWLEELRKAEPYIHHSTQSRAVTKRDQTDHSPSWFS